MVALPGARPVTTPEIASTDATEGLLLIQVPPTLPLLVSVVANPAQTDVLPLIVPAFGSGFTLIWYVVLAVPHTLAEPTV
jgi:hypothetical protein